MRIIPFQVFLGYLAVVFLCAVSYFGIPGLFVGAISFADSLYFSVVTITTLGYGDIHPVSNLGKFIAAGESLFGVVMLGLFLLAVSYQLIETQERKRIDSAKENLKTQYEYWRKDTVMSLLFLSRPGSSVSSDLAKELYDANKFREYFKENNSERWYAVANNLSSDNYYTIELIRGLESLQHHIETFIVIAPITDSKILKKLTGFVNYLNRLRRLDMDNYDDQKSFSRDLWAITALWDFTTGEYGQDHFMEAIYDI